MNVSDLHSSDLQVKFGKNLENVINPIDSAFDGDQNVDVIKNDTTTEQGMNQQRCSKFKPLSKLPANFRNLVLSSGVSLRKISSLVIVFLFSIGYF